MTFLQRQETSRISSREKGSVYRKGGGSSRSLKRLTKDSTIVSLAHCSPSSTCSRLPATIESPSWTTWYTGHLITDTSNGQAACMIIEEYPPLPTKPRQTHQQDTTHRFLNHLVLPKHRTPKFSSNSHRKLQPFRKT